MSFSSLVKRLILDDEPDIAMVEDGPRPLAEPVVQTPPPMVLCRDEIVDAQGRICGYRFHAGARNGAPAGLAGLELPRLQAEAIAAFARKRMAVLPLDIGRCTPDELRPAIAGHTVFLLNAPDGAHKLDAWLETTGEIKALGARIALERVDLANARGDVLELADMVFLDLRDSSLRNCELLAQTLHSHYPALQLVAEGVTSWSEYRMCLNWGIRYCLGGFLATADVEEKACAISPGQLALIEMLNLLRRDAELQELSALAKRDPGVAMQIIAMANSALLGRGGSVANVDQAIIRIGREWLYRSLTIALFNAGKRQERDQALLELTLSRARFMELVAAESESKQTCEELFVVGLLSLLDRLLKLPMSSILAKLKLPAAVGDALLRRDGPHAAYLSLAIAVERGDTNLSWELAAGLEIAAEDMEQSSIDALAWAQQAMSVAAARPS